MYIYIQERGKWGARACCGGRASAPAARHSSSKSRLLSTLSPLFLGLYCFWAQEFEVHEFEAAGRVLASAQKTPQHPLLFPGVCSVSAARASIWQTAQIVCDSKIWAQKQWKRLPKRRDLALRVARGSIGAEAPPPPCARGRRVVPTDPYSPRQVLDRTEKERSLPCPMLPEEAHGMLPEEEHDRAALPQPGLSEWVCSGSFVEIIDNGFGCWLSVSAGMPSRAAKNKGKARMSFAFVFYKQSKPYIYIYIYIYVCINMYIPSLRCHFSSVTGSRYLRRPIFVLFTERMQARGKRCKSPEKH